jgi:hypothetical protein
MHFDDDGGWETVSREHETLWLFVPYDLAEDIWAERTGGASPSRLTLCRWMTDNHLLLVVLADSPGSGRAFRFQQDPRFIWVSVPAGSDLDLQAKADYREFFYSADELLDVHEAPIVRTLLH